MVFRTRRNPLAQQLGYALGQDISRQRSEKQQEQQRTQGIEDMLGYLRSMQGQQNNRLYQEGADVREIQGNPGMVPS